MVHFAIVSHSKIIPKEGDPGRDLETRPFTYTKVELTHQSEPGLGLGCPLVINFFLAVSLSTSNFWTFRPSLLPNFANRTHTVPAVN